MSLLLLFRAISPSAAAPRMPPGGRPRRNPYWVPEEEVRQWERELARQVSPDRKSDIRDNVLHGIAVHAQAVADERRQRQQRQIAVLLAMRI